MFILGFNRNENGPCTMENTEPVFNTFQQQIAADEFPRIAEMLNLRRLGIVHMRQCSILIKGAVAEVRDNQLFVVHTYRPGATPNPIIVCHRPAKDTLTTMKGIADALNNAEMVQPGFYMHGYSTEK